MVNNILLEQNLNEKYRPFPVNLLKKPDKSRDKNYIYLVLTIFILSFVSCSDSDSKDPEPEGKIVDSTHYNGQAWRRTDCFSCHHNPVDNHSSSLTESQCSNCHGGNGACSPNGGAKTDHQDSDDCLDCHSGKGHGFHINANCINCHFATEGVIDCTQKHKFKNIKK